MKVIIFVCGILVYAWGAQASIAKPAACFSILEILRHEREYPSKPETHELLSSFNDLGNLLSGGRFSSTRIDIAAGFISDREKSILFEPADAANRIKGIFAYKESRQSTFFSATLRGREEIVTFLTDVLQRSKKAEIPAKNHVVLYSLATAVTGSVAVVSSYADASLATLFFSLFSLPGPESALRYYLLKTNNMARNLQSIRTEATNFAPGRWAFYAENFELPTALIDRIIITTDTENWKSRLLEMEVGMPISAQILSLPVQFLFFRNRYAKQVWTNQKLAAKSWVGLDMFLHEARDGSPYLEIVIRVNEMRNRLYGR